MDKKISYLSRNFNDYREALKEFSKSYYPDLSESFDDASVGSWMIDLNAAIADELSYHIDRTFQETNIDSAMKDSSVFAIARNNGFRIPGPKGAMAEVQFSCTLPTTGDANTPDPDWTYAPIIKKGTRVTAGSQVFELQDDVNFAHQFNFDGIPDRTHVPIRDSQNRVIAYRVTKLGIVVAGETRIYRKSISASDVVPFMEVIIPVDGVMNVESVVVKDGSSFQSNPIMGEFFSESEELKIGGENYRFFEVENLLQQERWTTNYVNGMPEGVSGTNGTFITRGKWEKVEHKFITEFTDNGYLKIIFGSGEGSETNASSDYSQYMMQRMLHNDNLGILPKPDSTIFVLYRVGGGKASNVAAGAINNIAYLNAEMGVNDTQGVKQSIRVTNTTPSVSGKDRPTVNEIRGMLKYWNGAQNRCITVKDYISRVLNLPPKYGTPFRVTGIEANNKIMLFTLGMNSSGKLDKLLPSVLVNNIKDYLKKYRSINDFIELSPGRIINLSFEISLFVDKNYNKADVVSMVASKVRSYMDANKHEMGDDIFIGDLEKEISGVDGVISIISLRVFNEYGSGYSSDKSTQSFVDTPMCDNYSDDVSHVTAGRSEIDLNASDNLLKGEGDSMFEIKYPEKDIIVRIKEH